MRRDHLRDLRNPRLENKTLVKIQTDDSPANPITAMKKSIDDLQTEFDTLDRYFREEVQNYRETNPA